MTEATEFLVWCRALAETPARLAALLADAPAAAEGLVASMLRHDSVAAARLAALLGAETSPRSEVGGGGTTAAFAVGRARLLALLERVDGSSLHRELRLPSGKTLDPWRLAGELAELDVRHLAALRALVESSRSGGD